jgi:hypothetical protein
VIDLRRGELAHWVQIEGIVTELYHLALLPGVRCPQALGFKSDEIERLISFQVGKQVYTSQLAPAARGLGDSWARERQTSPRSPSPLPQEAAQAFALPPAMPIRCPQSVPHLVSFVANDSPCRLNTASKSLLI